MPLVMGKAELVSLRTRLEQVAVEMGQRLGHEGIHFGTMIELPRAALVAGELARHADFFSFGSNDLTQMTFGFSRDDAEEKFSSSIWSTHSFRRIRLRSTRQA